MGRAYDIRRISESIARGSSVAHVVPSGMEFRICDAKDV